MKTSKIILPVALAAACAMSSCDDVFEPAAENLKEVDAMLADAGYAQGILGNAYILLPYSNSPQTDYATDDAVCNDLTNSYLQMATGSWTSQTDPTSQWQNRLNAVQYINLMTANARQVHWSEDADLQELFSDLFEGDAYGMRAVQYFYLLRAHAGIAANGEMLGVPIITEYQDKDANFNLPRNSFKDCIAFILSDIERALSLLPYEYDDITDENLVPAKYKNRPNPITAAKYSRAFGTHQKGKINGMILKALRAQVALFAASPAYAHYSGVTMADAAQYAGELLGDKTMPADGFKWFTNTSEIGGLSKGYNSKESIWQTNVSDRHDLESSFYPPSINGQGRCNPTQNLVDAFPMANGYPITDTRSGYDKAKPYEGRDPRLATYVLYNGQTMGSSNKTVVTGTYQANNVDGLNYTQGYSTRTGYYMRKFLRSDVNLDPSNTTNQKSYDARIRWTEIYLIYAEAANEAGGPKATYGGSTWTAESVIAALRERAGICAAETDEYLAECAASKEKMRELIRNERRLELCFENHRFYDLRRWQVSLDKLNEAASGVKITAEDGTYTVEQVETRNYKDYQYFGPIPYTEVMKYSNLLQNKGW